MAHRADDQPLDPSVVVVNPDDEVTPATFTAWLDQLQRGEPIQLDVTAAETLGRLARCDSGRHRRLGRGGAAR